MIENYTEGFTDEFRHGEWGTEICHRDGEKERRGKTK